MELKLMDFRNKFVKSVEVKENELIIISIISGDSVLFYPEYIDTCKHRSVSVYDGMVRFLATKENIEKANSISNSLELLEIFNNKKEVDLGEEWS